MDFVSLLDWNKCWRARAAMRRLLSPVGKVFALCVTELICREQIALTWTNTVKLTATFVAIVSVLKLEYKQEMIFNS
jgi:hypothetical protein